MLLKDIIVYKVCSDKYNFICQLDSLEAMHSAA